MPLVPLCTSCNRIITQSIILPIIVFKKYLFTYTDVKMNGLVYQSEKDTQQTAFPLTSDSNYRPSSASPNFWPTSISTVNRPDTRPFLANSQIPFNKTNIATFSAVRNTYSTDSSHMYNTRSHTASAYSTSASPHGGRHPGAESSTVMAGRGVISEASRARGVMAGSSRGLSGRYSQETTPSTVTAQDSGRRSSTSSTPSRGIKRQLDVEASPSEKRRCSVTSSNSDTSPTKSPNDDKMNKISQLIWEHFLDIRQTEEIFKKKIRLREALYSVLKGVFPYCGLYLVGSSMNGFGTVSSDMDMCLMLTQQEVNQRSEAPEVLRIINKSLKKCKFIRNPNVIKAKVPILRFTDTISEVECDLNINNGVGIRNTHLLNAYAQADWRVRPLTMYIKRWAKKQDINDASKASVSSYSLVLMVIHYLQCGVTPCVLPNLQQTLPHKFKETIDVRQLKLDEDLPPFNNSNSMTLGDLFLGFLKYYDNFDYLKYGISIRCGEKVPVDVLVRNPKSDVREWKYLCIEEPFLLTNTARSVFDPTIWKRIRRVISTSYQLLSRSRDLNTITEASVLNDR